MPKVTDQEVKSLAQISQILIKEEDIPKIAHEIAAVLDYASCLKNIEIPENLEPFPKNVNILRRDCVVSYDSDSLLALAPKVEDRYYIVPVIIKQNKN